ncbi:hypothetical protein AAMO2058_000327100 [Amorphochlora amoebiformis]
MAPPSWGQLVRGNVGFRFVLLATIATALCVNLRVSSSHLQVGRKNKKRDTVPLVVPSHKVYSVLKQIHPDIRISKKAMKVMNSFVNDQFDKIASEAARMLKIYKKTTLTSREIQASVRLLLPGELAKHAVARGTKALAMFKAHKGKH